MAFAAKLQMLLMAMFMLSGSVEALQLNQGSAQIPDVAEVLQKPHEVMNEISTNVDALTVSLSEVRQQHTAQVAKQKADLEQKLAAQKAGNARIAETNEKTAVEISKWKEANQQLRWRASGLRKKSDELRSTLKIMLANMSYAEEFTDNALGDANQKLRNASEVQILFDLDAKETERNAELAHVESLHKISASSSIAMLEVGAKVTRKHRNDANDLLKMLSSALNQLSVEQNASLASLQEQFETLFHKGQERRTSLLTNQTMLNETRSSVIELNQRLQAAVDHLAKAKKELEAHVASARTFLATLGQRALPGQSHPLVAKTLVADQTLAFRQALPKVITEASKPEPKKTNLRAEAAKATNEANISKATEVSSAVKDSRTSSSLFKWLQNAKQRLVAKLH